MNTAMNIVFNKMKMHATNASTYYIIIHSYARDYCSLFSY